MEVYTYTQVNLLKAFCDIFSRKGLVILGGDVCNVILLQILRQGPGFVYQVSQNLGHTSV